MIGFYKEGDVESARAIDEELAPLVEALGVTINPVPVKAALNLLGHEVGGLRLPLVEATGRRGRGRPVGARARRADRSRARLETARRLSARGLV